MAVVACVDDPPSGIADVGQLYAEQAVHVRRLVRNDVRASGAVIDDACQVAWSRLLRLRTTVRRDTAVAWLVRTAIREAFRSTGRAAREVSFEGLLDEAGELPGFRCAPSLEELFERRARLDAIGTLPRRQQRLMWLQACGFNYMEMGERTGDTTRTVDRQLVRARKRLAAEAPGSA